MQVQIPKTILKQQIVSNRDPSLYGQTLACTRRYLMITKSSGKELILAAFSEQVVKSKLRKNEVKIVSYNLKFRDFKARKDYYSNLV